jgi:hypothetical protein|tara:strand:- start:660 stop:830 length:171 start_codon:yes stop_codon:yes gene_type:complete
MASCRLTKANRIKEVEKENARHRWATSDLTLDNQILSEVVQGAVEGRGQSALKRYP